MILCDPPQMILNIKHQPAHPRCQSGRRTQSLPPSCSTGQFNQITTVPFQFHFFHQCFPSRGIGMKTISSQSRSINVFNIFDLMFQTKKHQTQCDVFNLDKKNKRRMNYNFNKAINIYAQQWSDPSITSFGVIFI